MNNLAIIPARSGSKGLKDKNVKLLNGIPMIGYSIKAALDSACFSEIMVSTDDVTYQNIALDNGAKVPFLRCEDTSTDTAGSWDVVLEVLYNYSKLGRRFDTVCLLQPTSPLRKASHIKEAYGVYMDKNAEAVTSVNEVEHSPLWTMVLPEDGSLKFFRQNIKNNVPRQKLEKYYRLNGAIYIRKIIYKDEQIFLCDNDEYAYVMDKKYSVDIDTIDDFEYAEYLMIRGQGK